MKKFLCWLLGHEPRGPIQIKPVLYSCDRCKETIYFDIEKGWKYYE